MDEMGFFADTIMKQKYSHTLKDGTKETWENIAWRVTKNVLKAVDIKMTHSIAKDIFNYINNNADFTFVCLSLFSHNLALIVQLILKKLNCIF